MNTDPVTTKPDGTLRHPATAGVLKHFRYAHLPEHLQAVSRPCGELAFALPEGPDLTCGLRDLLTAKDNFVRARLDLPAEPVTRDEAFVLNKPESGQVMLVQLADGRIERATDRRQYEVTTASGRYEIDELRCCSTRPLEVTAAEWAAHEAGTADLARRFDAEYGKHVPGPVKKL